MATASDNNKKRSQKCCYIGCSKSRSNSPNLTFFQFPTTRPSICDQWIDNCANGSLSDLAVNTLKRKVVCQLHFKEECFFSTLKNRLKKNAIPTMYTAAEENEIEDINAHPGVCQEVLELHQEKIYNEEIGPLLQKGDEFVGRVPSFESIDSSLYRIRQIQVNGTGAEGSRTSIPNNGKQKSAATAGSKKRLCSEEGKGEIKKRTTPSNNSNNDTRKTEEDHESEFGKAITQDPFEMIEIEESKLKIEVSEDQFSGLITEGNTSEGTSKNNIHFETVYCTSETIKEEGSHCTDTLSDFEIQAVETSKNDTLEVARDFAFAEIKTEPLYEDEGEDENLESTSCDTPLMWRCPLVICSEMLRSEVEMYQHLNLNHASKGLAVSSKFQKTSVPKPESDTSVSTVVISSSSSPTIGTSSRTGMMSFTQTSLQHFPVTVASVSTPVTTSQPVPYSSSGPVTVTTTYSYSSLPISSTSSVNTVPNPSVSSASKTTSLPFLTPVFPTVLQPSSPSQSFSTLPPTLVLQSLTSHHSYSSVPMSSTLFMNAVPSPSLPLASTTSSLSLNTPVLPPLLQPPSPSQSFSTLHPTVVKSLTSHHSKFLETCNRDIPLSTTSQSSLPAVLASQEHTKFIASPSSNRGSDSRKANTFSPLPPQPTQTTVAKSPQVQYLHIYQQSEILEDFPPCAFDDTEMFAISLSRFPTSKRAPIKRKLLDVVDCFSKKNVSPDKLVIAYYSNIPKSRSV